MELDVEIIHILKNIHLVLCSLGKTDLRVSSLQCGLLSPAESSFIPESCRSLALRSSSLRLEETELRTEARASQDFSDRLQPISLKTTDISIVIVIVC